MKMMDPYTIAIIGVGSVVGLVVLYFMSKRILKALAWFWKVVLGPPCMPVVLRPGQRMSGRATQPTARANASPAAGMSWVIKLTAFGASRPHRWVYNNIFTPVGHCGRDFIFVWKEACCNCCDTCDQCCNPYKRI